MPLRILKASAGSGKTYSLTESYVSACLEEGNHLDFTNIMAITFTNKATAEMKDRVIALLYTLAHNPGSYSGIGKLEQDLKMDMEWISGRSRKLLYRILKGFDFFAITTIDSFFTRLYRSMALDLFEEVPREITLDIATALNEAATALLRQAENDAELNGMLIDLIRENFREGRGVNLKNRLTRLGGELLNDRYLILREKEHYVSPEREFHGALRQSLEVLEADFESYKTRIRGLLDRAGMGGDDFNRGFVTSILEKREDIDDLLNLKGFAKLLNPGEWFTKKEEDIMRQKVAPIQDELQGVGREFYEFCLENRTHYLNLVSVFDNYSPYRAMRHLEKALNAYFEEMRILPLSEVDMKIRKYISDEDFTIVYEKIGQYLHSIMIDEFQDTSLIQWKNLEPMIRNNLAEGYPNLVVGDVKQAIYRFRNGNWEIMELQVPEIQRTFSPDGRLHIENLPINWRSKPEIVEFNNSFFGKMTEQISDTLTDFVNRLATEYNWPDDADIRLIEQLAEAARKIYKGHDQEVSPVHRNQTGYVEVFYRYFDKEEKKEKFGGEMTEAIEAERMEWLKTVITDLNKEGYRGGDIGILTRSRKEGARISEYLSRWLETSPEFNFSSEESLKLCMSDAIQLLMAAFQLKIKGDKDINEMIFRNYYLKIKEESWEASLPGAGNDLLDVSELRPEEERGISGLYVFFETLINRYGLSELKGQYSFLLTFLEEVKTFENEYGVDAELFMKHWEERIKDLRISMSADPDKIRLFTIHKSKGLEFEVVLMPYGQWKLENTSIDQFIWESVQDDEVLKYGGALPVKYGHKLLHSSFYKAMVSEYLRNVIDHVNLLYVALTRPRTRLYIWLSDQAKSKFADQKDFDRPLTETLNLFRAGLEGLGEESQVQTWGKKIPKSVPEKEKPDEEKVWLTGFPYRRTALPLRLKPSFDGSENEAIGRGLVIHRILEYVKFREDIPVAVRKALMEGEIPEEEVDYWQTELERILDFEPVRPFFEQNWKVWNEKSVMVESGGEYRPDRIQENDREFVVIDYKTGNEEAFHKNQIGNYNRIIAGIVRRPVRSFIYYLSESKLVEIK